MPLPNTATADYASSDDEEYPLMADDDDDDHGGIHNHNNRSPALSSSLRYSYGSPTLGKHVKIRQRRHRVSDRLRWLTNGSALLCVFMFSGIIFGWAPLKLILQREGQFARLCGHDEPTPCVAQTIRFNRIFTSAQFFLSFASLPVGFFLDHCSKVTHYAVAAVLEITGLLLVAAADYSDTDDVPFLDEFLLGYTLMSLGGGMAMMGAFPASFLLPAVQGGILAGVSCLFDASSIVFAVFAQLHAVNAQVFSRSHLFTAYAAVAAIIYGTLALCWASLERHDWKLLVSTTQSESEDDVNNNNNTKKKSEDNYGSVEPSEVDSKANESKVDPHTRRIQVLGLHDWPLLKQLATLDFVVVLLFASVHMLRCNFYIETVNEMLLNMGQFDEAIKYAQIFSFVLPMGVIFVPLIDGTVRSVGIVNTLHLTNVVGIVFGSLLLVPSLPVQGLNFVVFTGFRAYLYATLNTYVAVTFGVSTMGRVIGFSFTTAAVVTLLQYPAATLAEDVYGGDFTVTNVLFLAVGTVVPVGLASYYSRVVARTGQTE